MWRRGLTRAVLCLAILRAAELAAEDWPRFRGINGSGVSASTGIPSDLGPETHRLWSVEAGAGSSSPVIAQGKVFLSVADGNQRRLRCLDAQTGQQLWEQSLEKVRDENASSPNGPATCTPAVEQDLVVVLFPDTALACFTASGQLRWRADIGPFHSMHGIAASPIIVEGKVIVQADQIQGSYLAAFDLQSGERLWQVERTDGVTGAYSTPSVISVPGQTPWIVATGPQGLCAYDVHRGATICSVPGVANAPVTVPVVAGTTAYLCEPPGEGEPMDKYANAFDADKDGRLALEEVSRSVPFLRLLTGIDQRYGNGDRVVDESEWKAAFDSMVGKGGLLAIELSAADAAETPRVQWSYTKSVPYVASPVCHDGVLYLVDDGGIFMSVDAADGSVLKRGRLKQGGRQFYASPVIADGKVFVVDTDGRLTVLQAGGADWQELSSTELGEPVFATPAICDGRLFVRTESKLYCFGAPHAP